MIFKGGDLDAVTALQKTAEVLLRERDIILRYTRSEGLRGIYHCAQCGCKVPQIYELEFRWMSTEAKKQLHIRVLERWDIDREFVDGLGIEIAAWLARVRKD